MTFLQSQEAAVSWRGQMLDAWDTDFIWAFPLWPGNFSPTQRPAEETGGAVRGGGRRACPSASQVGPRPPAHPISGKRKRGGGKEEKVPQLPWAERGKSAVIDGRGHGGLTLQQEADLQPGTATIYQRSVTRRGCAPSDASSASRPKYLSRRDSWECVETCPQWFVFLSH